MLINTAYRMTKKVFSLKIPLLSNFLAQSKLGLPWYPSLPSSLSLLHTEMLQYALKYVLHILFSSLTPGSRPLLQHTKPRA